MKPGDILALETGECDGYNREETLEVVREFNFNAEWQSFLAKHGQLRPESSSYRSTYKDLVDSWKDSCDLAVDFAHHLQSAGLAKKLDVQPLWLGMYSSLEMFPEPVDRKTFYRRGGKP